MKITGLKEGEKITIEQTQAVEKGKHIKLDETVQDVAGQLHKVEVREYEPRAGEKAKELKIWLKDAQAGEMYAVSCNLNSIGRSIINTILALQEPYGTLMIKVYNKRDTGFPAAYIEHNGEKSGWKYHPKDLTHLIDESPVKKNGVTKIEKDYFRQNEFLINELLANVASKLSRVPAQFQDAITTDIGADNLPPEDNTDGTDDLPF